ncbi:MAG TPA: HPP family protein [Acidimicrobiales bacterium]|nr:HPP family protein [Acidimicrobiales bacterium]
MTSVRDHRALGVVLRAGRLAAAAGAALAVVGLVDRYEDWPLLTATLGPTAYLFAADPTEPTSRRRNAIVGHSVAILAGLAALGVFGIWHQPSATVVGHVLTSQAFATAAALATTLLVLEIIDRHHAPAAATAVLVTTGLAQPGRPLLGLVCGLALLIALSPLLAWGPRPPRD